jgi:hypothetical protein
MEQVIYDNHPFELLALILLKDGEIKPVHTWPTLTIKLPRYEAQFPKLEGKPS